MNLSGWQAIAGLGIASILGLGGAAIAAFVPNGPAAAAAVVGLFNLASGIIGGTFALLQRSRDPNSRSRASDRDRSVTAAQGVPAYDPHKTPKHGTQPMPPARRP